MVYDMQNIVIWPNIFTFFKVFNRQNLIDNLNIYGLTIAEEY